MAYVPVKKIVLVSQRELHLDMAIRRSGFTSVVSPCERWRFVVGCRITRDGALVRIFLCGLERFSGTEVTDFATKGSTQRNLDGIPILGNQYFQWKHDLLNNSEQSFDLTVRFRFLEQWEAGCPKECPGTARCIYWTCVRIVYI